MSVTQRHCRLIGAERLAKLTLYSLIAVLLLGEALADPNLPTSSLPSASRPSALVLAAPSTDAAVQRSTVATITANQRSRGPTIPANFVGFSEETQDVIADSIFT